MKKIELKKENVLDIGNTCIMVLLSAFLIGFNLNSFVSSAGVYPGGFNGITILIQRILETYAGIHLSFSMVNYPLNFLLIILSYRILGKRFTISTVAMIILTGIFADTLPKIVITDEVLLSSVFGGILNGIAIGLCLRGKASGGGTDIVGILISHKYNKDPWNYVFMGNVAMLAVAGYLFGWNQALYSIIFQYAATQFLQIMYRKYQRHTLFIITNKPSQVYEAIKQITNHGATVLDGMGCYKNEERSMVYSVISSMELKQVIHAAKEIDEHAFINAVKTDRLDGRFYQE